MSGHTPGPWQRADTDGATYINGEHEFVCHIDLPPGERRDANARLIATAPELLAAAKDILRDLHSRMDAAGKSGAPVPVFNGIAALNVAIAKAEGRHPS